MFNTYFCNVMMVKPGFEFRLAYSSNASDICKLRVTFIQARKILHVAFKMLKRNQNKHELNSATYSTTYKWHVQQAVRSHTRNDFKTPHVVQLSTQVNMMKMTRQKPPQQLECSVKLNLLGQYIIIWFSCYINYVIVTCQLEVNCFDFE